VEKRLDGWLAVRRGEQYLPVEELGTAEKPKAPAGAKPVQRHGAAKPGSDWNKNFDLKKGPKIWQAAQQSGHRKAVESVGSIPCWQGSGAQGSSPRTGKSSARPAAAPWYAFLRREESIDPMGSKTWWGHRLADPETTAASLVEFALILIITSERAIDEPNHAGAIRAGRFVIRDDLAGNGIDLGRGGGVKRDELTALGTKHISPASHCQHALAPHQAHLRPPELAPPETDTEDGAPSGSSGSVNAMYSPE
jgi:hypothetical protein